MKLIRGTEEITQVEACYAYMVSIDANSTVETIINNAVKKAYGLKVIANTSLF